MNSPDRIPFYSTFSFEVITKLRPTKSFNFAMDVAMLLVMNDDIITAMTVDITPIKDSLTAKTYAQHVKFLSDANVIKRVGNRNSRQFLVNPAFAHKFRFKQQEEYRARYGSMFMNISIP